MEQLRKTLILCSSQKHLEIAKAVDKRFNAVITSSYCFLFIPSEVNCDSEKGKIYNPLNAEYFRKTEISLLSGQKNYFQSLCDNKIINREIKFPNLSNFASDKVNNILKGLKLNNSIFLMPTANTICSFDMENWQQLVTELSNHGYTVYYNAHDVTKPLNGAQSVDFSFTETIYFSSHFSSIIGVRSGMMEIVLEVKDIPCLAFYKNFSPINQIYLTSREVMAGFSLHHLPIKTKKTLSKLMQKIRALTYATPQCLS